MGKNPLPTYDLHPPYALTRIHPKLIAWAALQVVFIFVMFLSPTFVMPLGILLTLLFGVAILLEPLMSLVAVAVTTFLIHSQIIGKEYILSILGVNWYAMDWILVFAALSWLIRWSSGVRFAPVRSPIMLPLVLFFLYLPYSAYTGIQQGTAVKFAFADMRLFFYYTSFFLVWAFVRRVRQLEVIFFVTVVCGILGALPEIYASLGTTQIDVLTGQQLEFSRIKGMNEVVYPVTLVGCAAFFPFASGWAKKAVLLLAIAVSVTALYLSYARGSWLAALAGLAFLFVMLLRFAPRLRQNLKKVLFAMSAIGIVTVVLSFAGILPLGVIESRASLVRPGTIDISSLARLAEWQSAINDFSPHPLFGLGLGYIYHFYAPGIGNLTQNYVHNSYVYVLTKMGIAGFVLFIFLFMTALVTFYRGLKRLNPGTEMGLLVSYGCMLVVFMVKSLTTWHLNALENSIFVGVVLGAIALIESWSRTRSNNESDNVGVSELGGETRALD